MTSVVVAALMAWATSAQAQLTDVEQRIVAAVKSRSPQALELLEKSARINSGTLNAEGVREVGKLFRAEFDSLGFQTRWADMPPAMQRGGHLVAERAGTQGKRLLLLGHLDTVFEKDSAVATWERRGDRARGQGVVDMKGGNVVMLEALRALKAAGALDGLRLGVVLTGDEERPGQPLDKARADMIELAKRSDAALSFEGAAPLMPGQGVSIARRSAGGWNLIVKARPGHSSRVFSQQLGYGAIYEAARIINSFREQAIEPQVTFSVGVFLGGTNVAFNDDTATGTSFGKTNVIPRDAIVKGDLRYLTPEQGERVKRKMREIVAQPLAGATATIEFYEYYPPMPPTEGGQRLLELYSKTSQDAGFGTMVAFDPSARGAGDIQFIAPFIPGIDGLGAAGGGSHTDDEDVEIASIERGAIRAALFIYRLTRP